jgi:uracil-DNA glycosylase
MAQLPLEGTETSGADALIPDRPSLKSLREAAADCTACPLHKDATQTVFGEGLKRARLMMVGEQPGDREDREGKPFVGPAGRILDKALEEAGIERGDAYVTNVVKHFKWKPKGKRRIHQKPSKLEVEACKPWLEAELEVVKPRVLVALGATAAQSLLGRQFRVTKQRGELIDSPLAHYVTATIHPSAILRAEDRDAEYAGFVADLEKVAALL